MAGRRKNKEFDVNRPITIKEILDVLKSFDDDVRKVDENIVIETLKEAFAKAYIREIDAPDAQVRVEIDNGTIRLFHDLLVVEEETVYEELEISLNEAKKINSDIKVGNYLAIEKNVRALGRSATLHIKSILKQKVREAEKQAIYDEYSKQLGELVYGFVESVEERFVLVNLGRTLAIMPHSQQIPNEVYREGNRIRVLVQDVKKETKGAQVIVSRSDALLVKRLFEKEVPEIFQGTIEIKAIAREAGDRTKMAVYSKDENVDAIGSCIGPRGARVQVIIEEIKGEKIDVFLWSDDVGQLIKNSFAPANILACFYSEDHKYIVVVVDENQLSLAIGKKGKNVKLASKLTGRKIEIKTKTEIEQEGIDYISKAAEFENEQAEKIKEKEALRNKELQEQMLINREKIEELEAENPYEIFEDEDEMDETEVSSKDDALVEDEVEQVDETADEEVTFEETTSEEVEKEEVEKEEAEKEEISNEVKKEKQELKPRTDFVSKYEELASASDKRHNETKKKRKKKDDDERKLRPNEINRDKDYGFKVEYSEDELEEIEALEQEEEANSWIEDDDIDFDEYDSYYDEDLK